MNKFFTTVLMAAAFSFTGNIQAHHSSAPHFDHEKKVDIHGSFTKFRFVNPHAYIYFDADKGGETANWRCELGPASQLTRFGWTADMFEVGEKIQVIGTPARREDNVCYLQNIIREDGSNLARNGAIGEPVETVTQVSNRPDYLENGQPNISGSWITLSYGRNGLGFHPDWVASEAGSAAVVNYDVAYDDPILQCHFVNIIKAWNHAVNVNEIHQTEDTITVQYGFMDVVRTIHLNMDKHPADIEPSAQATLLVNGKAIHC